MGVDRARLTYVQEVLSRWKGHEFDSRLAVDVTRVEGEGVWIEQEIIAHYDALVWARDNWLKTCSDCGGFHFIADAYCSKR